MSLKWKLRNFKSNLKSRWHRFLYGYANVDVWNFDNWFLETIPKMLDKLKDEGYGHPYDMTPEEWENYVSEMSNHFKEAAKVDDFIEFPPGTPFSETSKAYEDLYKHCNEHLHKGFEMMEARFFDLWD